MSRTASLLLAAGLAVAAGFFLAPSRAWDLKVYAACARELGAGRDPYIRDVVIDDVPYPCMYPPLAIDLYRPVAALMDASPSLAVRTWNALTVLLFLGMLLIWRRLFLGPGPDVLRLIFALFTFGGPLFIVLRCGNGAAFEFLLIWSAFALFAAGRDLSFSLTIAAAALIKLQPAGFLGLLLLRPRPAWRYFFLGVTAFLLLFGLNEVVHPGLLASFRARLADPHEGWRWERGPNNCAVLGFMQHLLETAWGDRARADLWARRLFIPWALVITGATGAALRRIWTVVKDEAAAKRATVLLGCAAYALLAPRFKDYSYFILIPSALAALESDIPNGLRVAIVALAALDSTKSLAVSLGLGPWAILAGYFKMYATVLVWGVLAFRPHRPHSL
ncbi:MAG: glycosyltransferase family 87 protein [Elusimicrobiota bacterium]